MTMSQIMPIKGQFAVFALKDVLLFSEINTINEGECVGANVC